MSRIPTTAAPDVQESLRAAWAEIDRLKAAAGNRNAAGSRTINAGEAIEPSDYVTLGQLRRLLLDRRVSDDTRIDLSGVTRFTGRVFITALDDAGVVYAAGGGELTTDVDNLSWRYTNNSLRLGAATVLRWHHGAELRSGDPGVLEISGEDHDVSASLSRVALGVDNNGRPALVPNPPGLDIRRGGPGGALTDLACATLTGTRLQTSDTTMVHGSPGFVNGAGADVGTLNNAPAPGDPTKWVPIDDNGTTRYVPAW